MSGDSASDDMLRSFYERWLRLEEEKQAISDDLKELFAEAKGNGFDTKTMRAVFRDMTKDSADREEAEAVYDLYWSSLNSPRARPAYARVENIEQFPQSKGETNGPEVDPAASSFDEIAETNSNSSEPIQSPEAETDKAGDSELLPAIPAAPIEDDFEPPAFLRKEVA